MPANTSKIAIELSVDDKGTVTLNGFSGNADKAFAGVADAAERTNSRIKAGWEKLKSAWLGVTAAILAVKQGWDMMESAAKARQERTAFDNMAASYGASGKKILAELKRVSDGTINTMTLVQKAGTAMMMGITPEKISKLMEIARATARQTGQSVTAAFSDISLAVGRQSKMVLDNLGIIVSVEKANEDYARSLGKTSEQLTDAERKMAFLNATIQAGEEMMGRLGNQSATAADKLERFKAMVSNLKVLIGEGLLRVFTFLEGSFYTLASGATTAFAAIAKGLAWIMDKAGQDDWAAVMRQDIAALQESAIDLAGKATTAFKDTFSFGEKAVATQRQLTDSVKDTAAALEAQKKAQKELDELRKQALDAERADTDLRRQAAQEMYQKSGIDAQAYYANEAAQLIEKTAKWEKAGIDITKINQYLYDQFGKMASEAWEKGEAAAGDYLETMRAKSDVLISEFQQTQNDAIARLDAIGMKVKDLSGTDIALSMTLHDGVSAVVDSIIGKLQALQAAAAAAKSAEASASGAPSTSGGAPSGQSPLEGGAGGVVSGAASISGGNVVNEAPRSVVLNLNQSLSRSDVANIMAEQQRLNERG